MTKLLTLFTTIPWILYVIEIYYYRISIIEKEKLDKKKYFKYINKNFFSSINVKELLLFFIFIFFMLYGKKWILKILIVSFYMYLLIDFFMTLAKDCKKIKHKSLMVQTIIMVGLVLLIYPVFGKLKLTYILMFVTSILSSFIIYLFSTLTKRLK